jgi:mannose-6-phosphate isomerase-like protein (cupin superfamily)
MLTPHSQSTSPGTPISGGLYRLEKGTPLDYTYVTFPIPRSRCMLTLWTSRYSYDEIKIILEGHFYIKDETGREVKAEKGDVFFFPKGSRIIFQTEDYGLAFFVGQREKDTL